MSMTSTGLTALGQRIIRQATESDDGGALLRQFCESLVEAGVPLAWLSMATSMIDPSLRGIVVTWTPSEGLFVEPDTNEAGNAAVFKLSPVHTLLSEGRKFARWRLDGSDSLDGFPLLGELRRGGITDYALHVVNFAPGTALTGVCVALATDRHSGFADAELSAFEDVLPTLALAICKFILSRTLRETLSTYLGPATARQVIKGRIRRGEGETISAAILLVDLKDFTALTDVEDPIRVVGWLDEHLEALGEPVAQHGGEILKFLGDGFLAIFPVPDADAPRCAICLRALEAAELALGRNRALNERRRLEGQPELKADVVLHFGRVVYGNVGTGRRLDFTVIGRAVNEASRIERLCGELGHALLASDTFGRRCSGRLVPVGRFALRGVDLPREIWTLATADVAAP